MKDVSPDEFFMLIYYPREQLRRWRPRLASTDGFINRRLARRRLRQRPFVVPPCAGRFCFVSLPTVRPAEIAIDMQSIEIQQAAGSQLTRRRARFDGL